MLVEACIEAKIIAVLLHEFCYFGFTAGRVFRGHLNESAEPLHEPIAVEVGGDISDGDLHALRHLYI
jgi:hypothetical protein